METGQIQVLHEAIGLHREAIMLIPTQHPGQTTLFYSLANVLTTHFIQTSQIEDVVEAIAMYIEALRLRSASHPN